MIVEVTRGRIVESVHRVAAAAVGDDGRAIFAAGDVERPVYLRSAAKPLIAAAAIEAGVVRRFGLEPREIAVMASSHFGEPFHVEAVASILHKTGFGIEDLQCGTHLPYNEAAARALIRSGTAPNALYNNCSGKHAGILALCKSIGADPATYLDPGNPAQRRILALCARLSDDNPDTWPLGVDGCGIPVYATSLRRAALSFARIATLRGIADADAEALRTVRDAMIAYPEYVAGTDEFDTVLMRAAGGRIACKGGAEGVHAVAAVDAGIGYASKVRDGTGRARGPSTIAVLQHLGVVDDALAERLAPFGRPVVYNRAGRAVGEIRVAGLDSGETDY